MQRTASDKKEKAKEMFQTGMKLADIAKELEIPEGTIRSWKNRYKWDCNVAKKKCNVAKETTQRKKRGANGIEKVIENEDLSDKQKLFCIYYIRCFNATKAYQKAYGCAYATAATNGSALLRNTQVKEQIHALKQDKMNREFLSEEDIFQKYIDIAFSDITDYLEFGTEEAPVMTMHGPVYIKDEQTGEKKLLMKKRNVVYFKDSREVDGTILSEVKQGKDGASIKLSDRMKALQWLSEHMDMATEKQRAEIALLNSKLNESSEKEDVYDWIAEVLGEEGISDEGEG